MASKHIATLLLLALIAGCDSQDAVSESDDRPTVSIDRYSLVRAIADTALYTSDRAIVLNLTEYIEDKEGSGIYFSLHVDGDAILVEQAFNQLSIRPVTAGEATVTLSFKGKSLWQESFDVAVRCPTQRPHNLVSYFPHEIGQIWHYAYKARTDNPRSSGPPTWTQGELTWTLSRLEDQCDYLEFVLDERFVGTRRVLYDIIDTTFVYTWDKALIGRLVDDKLAIEGYTDGIYGGLLDSLQWLYPVDTSDIVSADTSINAGGGGLFSRGYTIEKGIGITRFLFSEYGRQVDSLGLNLIR